MTESSTAPKPITRAKFYVRETGKSVYGGFVKLSVVCRGKDNSEWAAATPVGEISMTVKNEAALAGFEPGDEFYVDFTPAPKGQEG